MSKRLVICCDGTWNTHDDPSPTNVFKLRNLILSKAADGREQAVYYDSGVGTAGGWLKRGVDGATGRGVSENVRQAYRAIIDNYAQDDEIFLFGFSRGAFTIRSLAGLIRNCGILRRDKRDLVEKAYTFYRARGSRKAPTEARAKAFRESHAVADVTRIRFIGVWDTVGSVGNPLLRHSFINRKLRFHDVKLSTKIDFSYQALAIDEHRKQFLPAIWHQQAEAGGQVMEQVWFIGAHADVGGGYAHADLSNIPLNWLAEKATRVGLGLDAAQLSVLVGKPGFPKYLPIAHDSHKSFYKMFPARDRIIDDPQNVTRGVRTNERLHWTVMARYKQDLGYRPANVVDYVTRIGSVLRGEPGQNPLLGGP